MSPAPSSSHQDISMNLTRIIDKVFYKTACKFYVAPFDVRLINFKESTSENQILSVVQPDLCVICDRSKVDLKGFVWVRQTWWSKFYLWAIPRKKWTQNSICIKKTVLPRIVWV